MGNLIKRQLFLPIVRERHGKPRQCDNYDKRVPAGNRWCLNDRYVLINMHQTDKRLENTLEEVKGTKAIKNGPPVMDLLRPIRMP